ncbi:MAG: FAD-binding protein, partial [Alphaproteobacteria bacterium]
GASFPEHFPTVFQSCQEAGIDPRTALIPVAPAEHYHMGGILTDAAGRTTLDGLWACGEVASTGVHGANRLASNSLLEAVAFAARIALDLTETLPAGRGETVTRMDDGADGGGADIVPDATDVKTLRATMTAHLSVERTAVGMHQALAEIDAIAARCRSERFRNSLAAARLIAVAAITRTESRGGHYRTDHPDKDDAWRRRSFTTFAGIAATSAAERIPA